MAGPSRLDCTAAREYLPPLSFVSSVALAGPRLYSFSSWTLRTFMHDSLKAPDCKYVFVQDAWSKQV